MYRRALKCKKKFGFRRARTIEWGRSQLERKFESRFEVRVFVTLIVIFVIKLNTYRSRDVVAMLRLKPRAPNVR